MGFDFIAAFQMAMARKSAKDKNRLSTGQKQLVALAGRYLRIHRFLCSTTTSSVARRRNVIQRAIDVVLKGRISVVIAHRLSSRAASGFWSSIAATLKKENIN